MIKRVLTLALAAALAVPAFAQDEAPASVVEKFKTMYPKTTFKEIRKSQVSGLYEVVMGENIAYTDESGRYFIFGHLFDMQQQVDLTAQRKLDSKKTEFPAQQLGQAIKTVKGDGSRILAVFSDPDCPYCKQLEGELARLDNVTIYTFLYPLESLHPEAKTKAVSVWCAPNKAKAWSELMLAGKKPKLVACNNPVNDNLVLGSKLGVVGTPTLIAADGRVLPGSAPAEKIDQWLNAGKPGAPAAAQEATQ
ncbi:thiol:disulfide interchange protein DsbC [Cupriavidus metallidurans]|jgi:thiol:disulfide interchange protein DsbC|uniref:Thiol:disulfide interchange protein n=3 Tax=Betaproteobacteria TaxID=28216 RepID=F4GGU4_ALIDK|nr:MULTISPECIES: DsbC family protein [Betaproteobacteria]ABM44281.1 protein-disulfide isomerase [Acidovorax sp. JS42]MDN8056829.1 DsbC family protein [Burkholderia multivorans]TXH13589.1 MAG: DsbC family protein [Gammaproteobacteria bacterium]AEB87064.1 disulfide bond isomerase, DsbC/G [Alicycliphilus denitrificans K601]ART57399.1 disulfide isomerase [Acidovorax carolinensis]